MDNLFSSIVDEATTIFASNYENMPEVYGPPPVSNETKTGERVVPEEPNAASKDYGMVGKILIVPIIIILGIVVTFRLKKKKGGKSDENK